MKQLIAGACLLALSPMGICAYIVPTSTAIDGSGPFTWVYEFQLFFDDALNTDQDVMSGAVPGINPARPVKQRLVRYLTIFDFAGYVSGSCGGPKGWYCSVQDASDTSEGITLQDRPDLVNLTWTQVQGQTAVWRHDGVDLGSFSADSVYDAVGTLDYASGSGLRTALSAERTAYGNVGTTFGPSAVGVPEPSTLALAGLALACIGWGASRARPV